MPPKLNNSSTNPQKSRITIIVICAVLVFGLIGYGLIKSFNSGPKPQQADQNHAPIYNGMDSFISDAGLTTDQVNLLIKAFSTYAPRARVVNINPSSLVPEAHDPNKDIGFTTDFKASIDNASYNGKVVYSGVKNVRMLLYSADGSLKFDSGNLTSP